MKHKTTKKYLWATIFLSCTIFLIARIRNKTMQTEDFASDMQHIGNEHILEVIAVEEKKSFGHRKSDYQVIHFNLSGKVKGLSTNQIDQHLELYAGYVKKWNQIEDALQTVDRKNISATYSPFRALKVGETYAMNGTILHELYFKNLGDPHGKPLPKTKKLLEKHFGSVEAYLQDLKDCGMAARGWVLTCYSLFDKSVRNYVLDTHNDHVPIMVIPLIVLDVYEHAYMIEFGIRRAQYLNVFVDNINWPIIEERVKELIH
jgi:superoxide dismutase, Fe-Mn family